MQFSDLIGSVFYSCNCVSRIIFWY